VEDAASGSPGLPARVDPAPVLVVLSDTDPVAQGLAARWGSSSATGDHVDGVPVRRLEDGFEYVRRPGPHVHDEHLEQRVPAGLIAKRPTLVFPSIHRSESQTRCLTVHPLGNPSGRADFGGRPRSLVPTDPRRMAAVLREMATRGEALGLPATYESTHHGPELGLAAFFAEIAVVPGGAPSEAELDLLARALRDAVPEGDERVALALGGGHYAPRFTDLARRRRWAFGHILSRHALADLEPATARQALAMTPGAEGVVFARGEDRHHPALQGLAPELRDSAAPPRESPATARSPRTSGT
jgi:D-aminoacyl-tRNA deacylase